MFLRVRIVSATLAVLLTGLIAERAVPDSPVGRSAYTAEIEKWRSEREAIVSATNGWLSVAALFFLKEGRNTFGSLSSNDLVLPTSAPARAGWFDVRQGRVFANVNSGVDATFDQRKVQTGAEIELKETADLGGRQALVLGPLTLFVHLSGERLAIRMLDAGSALRRNFKGLTWFPIDAAYRVDARFVPFEAPKSVEVPNILGDLERFTSPGTLNFTLNGEEHRLQPFQVGKAREPRFFIVFRDLTSGKETYEAARFVYAPMPEDGTTVIDFNRAYNPPCAYNPFTTCPLPPPSNRLNLRILAGEKRYEPARKQPTP